MALDPGRVLFNYGVLGLLFAPDSKPGEEMGPPDFLPEWMTWKILSTIILVIGIGCLYLYVWHLKSNDLWPTSEIPG